MFEIDLQFFRALIPLNILIVRVKLLPFFSSIFLKDIFFSFFAILLFCWFSSQSFSFNLLLNLRFLFLFSFSIFCYCCNILERGLHWRKLLWILISFWRKCFPHIFLENFHPVLVVNFRKEILAFPFPKTNLIWHFSIIFTFMFLIKKDILKSLPFFR